MIGRLQLSNFCLVASLVLLLGSFLTTIDAQLIPATTLANGNMESSRDERTPDSWFFFSRSGSQLSLDTADAFEGKQSALLDATKSDADADEKFTNLMQTIGGEPWRGKNVRFRAAVRTAEMEGSARAQLWFRVDRADATSPVGAFDNMQDRPIRGKQWQHYEIVLPVDDDAEKMVVGMFLIGSGKAWLDDVTLEEVDVESPTTGTKPAAATRTDEDESVSGNQATRFQLSPVLMKAMEEAETAPRQPFFNHWFWLAVIALTLFALSGLPPQEIEIPNTEPVESKSVLGPVPKFAVRFSVVYWLLYSFPAPFTSITFNSGVRLNAWYQARVNEVVSWVAEQVFKIEGQLVPPNGSGDTTFNYLNVLIVFVLAIAFAALWSLLDRRKTDYRYIKDLLRSYLRYVLALTMLGYGLAKVAWDFNQFPTISDYQLSKTWGDSSPMNVLWSFMGASRPYTIFAGLGEVVGGLLLVFRRTTTIGAFVVLGVMINVVMLNYCYDVPVKLYSTHLVCMALYLLLPEARRLANVLFWNRPTEPVEINPPYTGPVTIWIHRAIKLYIVVVGFGMPIYFHIQRHIDYFAEQEKLPDYFGNFEVEEYKVDGQVVSQSDGRGGIWKSVKFERLPYNLLAEREPANWISISIDGVQGNPSSTFSTEDNQSLLFDVHQNAVVPQGTAELTKLETDRYILVGRTSAGQIEVRLRKRVKDQSKLTGRGYRWINEVPFNR